MIWCTNDSNIHICILLKRWSLILGCFFLVSILKRGQYRYLRYLWDVIGWKLHHSRQYSVALPTAIATAELLKYVSMKFKQTKIFEKFTTLCQTVCSWIHCIEDITGRWRDEDIAVSSFSLYYSWLNNIIGLVSTCIRFYILFLPI